MEIRPVLWTTVLMCSSVNPSSPCPTLPLWSIPLDSDVYSVHEKGWQGRIPCPDSSTRTVSYSNAMARDATVSSFRVTSGSVLDIVRWSSAPLLDTWLGGYAYTQSLNCEDAAALAALFGTYNCCAFSGISIRIKAIKRLKSGKHHWSRFLCTYSALFSLWDIMDIWSQFGLSLGKLGRQKSHVWQSRDKKLLYGPWTVLFDEPFVVGTGKWKSSLWEAKTTRVPLSLSFARRYPKKTLSLRFGRCWYVSNLQHIGFIRYWTLDLNSFKCVAWMVFACHMIALHSCSCL